MLRPVPTPTVNPYRIEFSPSTWNRIGLMPGQEFQAVREVLERLADEAALAPWPHPEPEAPLRVTVEGKVLVYVRDDARRMLTLLDILEPADAL